MPSNKCSYPTTCWYPKPDKVKLYTLPNGKKPKLKFRDPNNPDYEEMTIPCRTCPNCLYATSTDWGIRAACEMKMHEENTYITLTYADMPKNGNLIPEDFLNFIQRLKYHFPNKTIRYLYSGERGGLRGRPHFHAIIFGIDFHDKIRTHDSASGAPMWSSQLLDKIWGLGMATVGEANANTAEYVAQYVVKKISADYDGSTNKTREAEHIDKETGDIIAYTRKGDYISMSRMPGIGHSWFQKYKSDIFPSCTMHMEKGGEMKSVSIPQYFYNQLKKYDPVMYEEVQLKRMQNGVQYAKDHPEESSPERLLQKATCAAKKREGFSRKFDTDEQAISPENQFLKALKIKQEIDARVALLNECNIKISRLYNPDNLNIDNPTFASLRTSEQILNVKEPNFYEKQRFKQLNIKNEAVKRLKSVLETKTQLIFEAIYRKNGLKIPNC